MKKLGLFLLICGLCVSLHGCGEDDAVASSSASVAQEYVGVDYSGQLYTTRQGDMLDYVIKEYAENGVLINEKTYASGKLVKENNYYADGNIKGSSFYSDSGDLEYYATYQIQDNKLKEMDYNADGSYRGRFEYTYNENALVTAIRQYDEGDKIAFTLDYYYEDGDLVNEQGSMYENGRQLDHYTNSYKNGIVVASEQISFDDNGNITYREIYDVVDGDYILKQKFDGADNPLPLE